MTTDQADMTEQEMERRMRELEAWRQAVDMWRGGVDSQVDKFRDELRNNTAATREALAVGHSVKGDTAEMVRLFQASKVNLAMLRWLGGFGAALAAVVGGIAAWRHWP